MAIKARGEAVDVNDQINLTVTFKNGLGEPTDLDSFPKVSIIQPSGLVLLAPTSVGVSRVETGKYSYIFTIPYNGPLGIWNDIWTGYMSGFYAEAQFSFAVLQTDVPAINVDGYVTLGDDPGFHYSQEAIRNINKLLKALKARLNSSGKAKSTDSFGNTLYVDCDIFSISTLVTFLATALSDFNQVPYFTFFQFHDDQFIDQFFEILIEGATLYALSSHALIEKGSEFTATDNGINFNPSTISDLMQTQYSTLLTHYFEKLKMIKASLRPHGIGLGTVSMSNATNPMFNKYRFLRARKLL